MWPHRDRLNVVKSLSRYLVGLITLGIVMIGCSTAPEVDEVSPAPPDPGLARIKPAKPQFDTLPAPSVKLVDLRRLRVGMTKSEVLEIFPGPEETELSPRDTTVWRYEFAELYFRENRLYNWFDLEQE